MILHQQNLDYNKHCRYAFGTYVQAHDEPLHMNTNQARALDCLYLRALGTHQGGHECWHIATNKVITRQFITPIPITTGVIRKVHSIAESDGMPPGLKITDRNNEVLFDSTWIAGVDYTEDNDDATDDDNNEIDDNYESNDEDNADSDNYEYDDEDTVTTEDFTNDESSIDPNEMGDAINQSSNDTPHPEPDGDEDEPSIKNEVNEDETPINNTSNNDEPGQDDNEDHEI